MPAQPALVRTILLRDVYSNHCRVPCLKQKASIETLALVEKLIEICHLMQVSLTIFRSVTRRSPYSSLAAAFSIWPSFFSSAFSCAFDSR